MIKPENIVIYLKLCETLSFTKTAEALNIPKSTVSDALKKLEDDLGVTLLKRTTRKVLITDEGQLLYEKGGELVANITDLENLFSDNHIGGIQGRIQGRIRVDMPIGLSKNLILPNLHEFLELYPEIELEISSSDRRVDPISEGFDFVIRVGSLKDSSLIAKKIGEHSIINCVGKKYVEKYGLPTTLNSLSKHFQIHYLQNLGVGRDGFEYFDGTKYVSLQTKSLITVNNSVAYTDACLAGLGIIQVPMVGVKDYLDSGEMIQILKKYHAEAMSVYFIYPNKDHMPKRVRLFMDWCEEKLKGFLK